MEIADNFLQSGIRMGTRRATKGLGTELTLDEECVERLRDVLEAWPSDTNGRFVELFAEAVTVACLARALYNEPPLTKTEMTGYLGHSISFFNSFTHIYEPLQT